MSLIAPNVGEQTMLKVLVNQTSQADLVVHLYTNVVPDGQDTVLSDFTEATEAGYSSVTTVGATWVISTETGTQITTAEYTDVAFTFTEDATLRGYYVTLSSGLVWYETFTDGPYTLGSGGGTVTFTPKITMD